VPTTTVRAGQCPGQRPGRPRGAPLPTIDRGRPGLARVWNSPLRSTCLTNISAGAGSRPPRETRHQSRRSGVAAGARIGKDDLVRIEADDVGRSRVFAQDQ
jgi:hypothetical protein